MTNYKGRFLEKSILGKTTKLTKSNEVLEKCIDLAYKDMMTAGRFYSRKFRLTRNEICEETKVMLEKNDFMFSRELIDNVAKLFTKDEKIKIENNYVTGYGLAQKLVNMTFKYFYVFSDYVFDNTKILDFSNCDCPLDSIILGHAEIKNLVWSKATNHWYIDCQNKISDLLKKEHLDLELEKLGNLAFDFLKW